MRILPAKAKNSVCAGDGVGLISVAHQAFCRLPSVSNPRQYFAFGAQGKIDKYLVL